MREDEPDRWKFAEHPRPQQARYRARGIDRELDQRRGQFRHQSGAARSIGGMDVDERIARGEPLEQRAELAIAEIPAAVVAQQADPVAAVEPESALGLADRSLDVRHRQGGEEPEAAGMLRAE